MIEFMHPKHNNGPRFQPKISRENSCRYSDLPRSMVIISDYRTAEELEEISKDPTRQIFYVLDDRSSGNDLIPLRETKRGRFCTIILLRN